jgi:NTE family protein
VDAEKIIMKKIGLVLSGGGVRGFAHLGLLKYLDELGIQIHAISGVSAGAIAGVLYAAGYKPDEIFGIMRKSKYFSYTGFSLRKEGLFPMEPMKKTLHQLIPEDSYEKLKIKFFATATDFSNDKAVTFSRGKLIDTVIASASVPVIFEPVRINDSVFFDGGLLNNLPVEPLKKICDAIIGCHVNKIDTSPQKTTKLSKNSILEKCFHMAIEETVYKKGKECDVFIEPPLSDFNMFDTAAADKIFKIGYDEAVKFKREFSVLQSVTT